MAASFLALFRGINVGGKNKLPMRDLTDVFVEAGCRDVQTYIQSGNVLFAADPDTLSSLSAALTARIAERFGLRVPVVLRTAAEIRDIVRHNPYLEQGAPEEKLHVVFLADQPDEQRIARLDPDRSPPDTFVVRGREIYLRLPNGAGRTKLTNDFFDRTLATISTARNWRTVCQLLALM